MNENSGNFGSFMVGLVIGAGVGATVALLKAPQSGDETRRQIQRTADELRKEASNIASTARTHFQEVKQELADHATAIKAESEAALEETKKALSDAAKDVKEETKEGTEQVRQTVRAEQSKL